ncbi:MAG: Holliday junction branch migration protein RuvA [Xanthomonadales bacterium]|nr:Holliday junction branch migration protein RuvA [Xanthomonadales bacterium]
MIGRLVGTLAEKKPPMLLIDVGGVGYEVEAPMSTIYDLPPVGKSVKLLTHLLVKEDGHNLYGFIREADRALFRELLKISGVGAKLALTILSGANADEFARLVADRDAAALTRLPGIGKKTADRLIYEMKDRLDNLPMSGSGGGFAGRGSAVPEDPAAEAVAALVALGYKPQEASRMVQKLSDKDLDSEAIIREALKAAVKR